SRLYDILSLENDGSNFQMWKYRINMILDVRGLWELVDGTQTTAPDVSVDPNGHADWLARDKEAHAQITLTLKDEPLSGVLYASTAAEVWKKLCGHYEGR
ncbi:hypothetical protein PISMIDRAFT_76563, partial [Pisolithus microcarpus 441]